MFLFVLLFLFYLFIYLFIYLFLNQNIYLTDLVAIDRQRSITKTCL